MSWKSSSIFAGPQRRPSPAWGLVENRPALFRRRRSPILQPEGYQLVAAGTAAAGLQMVRTTRPDLILLDVHLPGMSGYEVAPRLKADPATAAIPIVALTAQAMPGEETRARDAGCDAFLTKPVDTDHLRATVRRLLDGVPG